MDFGSWNICEQTVVLQGSFLLAEKLILPKTLQEASKSDWPVIEKPITTAIKEISQSNCHEWRKRAIAILWAKILSCRSMNSYADIERKWKEDVFFPVENLIPKINHTVLFELLKSLKSTNLYAELLLALPTCYWAEEVALIVNHVSDETSFEDVSFFLNVWWEVMKTSNNHQDETTLVFSSIASKFLSETTDEPCQRSKRFKPDPEQALTPADNTLAIFLEGLHKIRQYINNDKLKCRTIANLAETLCVSAFPENELEAIPIVLYLEKLGAIVYFLSTEAKNHSLSEMISEGERTLRHRGTAARFTLSLDAQKFGLNLIKDLLLQWGEELAKHMTDTEEVSYEAYRMADSLASLHKILIASGDKEMFLEEEKGDALELARCISSLQEKTPNIFLRCKLNDSDAVASIAMKIIDEKMDRHKEVCAVFASDVTWAFSSSWVGCLKRNHALFQEPDLIFTLLETVVKVVSTQGGFNMVVIRKVSGVILDLFSELSLIEKDRVLFRVLSSWGKEGLSHSLDAFTDCFQEELNTTFNQISQSVTDYSAIKAVSRVARLALLHPEAVVNKACHFAVVNHGAHVFLGKILTSLPALHFRGFENSESSLVSQCLMNTCWGKLSSAKEESQFLSLLTFLMDPSETSDTATSRLLNPEEVVKTFVLPYILDEGVYVELCLQILRKALHIHLPSETGGKHWMLLCSPFPLLLSLCKLLNSYTKYWQQSDKPFCLTLGSKELIIEIIKLICDAIIPEAEYIPDVWNKSLFWLQRKMEHLDWVVCLRLNPIFGGHFKKEVPASLFDVCKLPEDEWRALDLPEYGPGTGLLAWLECCCISDMKDQMLSLLSVNTKDPEEVNLFSKGFLVAMIQVLPSCSSEECKLLTQVVVSLLERQLLHVPYTLEYVQYMPLLNLRPFAYNLQFSILLLRVFQLLCSSSCSEWLSHEGQKHLARLYCCCMSDILEAVKKQLPGTNLQVQPEGAEADYVQEVLFIYTQVFCHVLHIMAMMPDNTCEPLYFLSLEILSLYEALRVADTSTNSLLRRANERHFLKSITQNVSNDQHRATLMQKIGKL
ncbi:gem-associated protein 4 [Spea bombifrons]|uniref:gem-associated protein 4 n=1 Tax=Spea bombifrons TaxID=233779 RepID=UPI00234A1BE1|nr:gem-associated protein 4 [Spea bombifrons]